LLTNEVVDLVGGVSDLEKGIIRCVGNPNERFEEDHLRKLRAIRFASRLGFEIHDDTFVSIYNNPTLNISNERIVNELETCFKTTKSIDELLYLLYDTNLINQVFKGILINEKAEVERHKIISFNTFIAAIVCPCNPDLNKKLVDLKYTLKLANSVAFLLKQEIIEQINPLQFYSKRKSTDLTNEELFIFNNKTNYIEWLMNFKPDENMSAKFMSEGFSGADLGIKLKEYYMSKFQSETAI